MPYARMSQRPREINSSPLHPLLRGIENESPPWRHRLLGWCDRMKSSSFGYLSHPIRRTTRMGILRSRRIKTMPPEVEATKKITQIASGTTIKVTTAAWSIIYGSPPRKGTRRAKPCLIAMALRAMGGRLGGTNADGKRRLQIHGGCYRLFHEVGEG